MIFSNLKRELFTAVLLAMPVSAFAGLLLLGVGSGSPNGLVGAVTPGAGDMASWNTDMPTWGTDIPSWE